MSLAIKRNKRPSALVTGAAKGIGKAIALELASRGFQVIINYKTSSLAAEEVCKEIQNLGGYALPFQADVSLRFEIEDMAKFISDKFGKLDVLVNNAGILEQKPFAKISDEDWHNTIDSNLKSVFLCTQIITKVMGPGGSIVNISSIGGEIGGPKAVHYAASKGAMLTFTKSSARVLSEKGIRVNAVTPGFIDTDMFRHITTAQRIPLDEIEATIPLGRIGKPEDVANAVSFLVDDKSNYITGQVVRVNGGLLI